MMPATLMQSTHVYTHGDTNVNIVRQDQLPSWAQKLVTHPTTLTVARAHHE